MRGCVVILAFVAVGWGFFYAPRARADGVESPVGIIPETREPEVSEMNLRLKDLDCVLSAVETALFRLTGITKVEIDPKGNAVTIHYHSAEMSEEQIKGEIEKKNGGCTE